MAQPTNGRPLPSGAEGADGGASFTTFVTAVTAAFGDPTRRDIYLRLRSQPGMTVAELAEAFSLHPNAARHHLDRLVAGGYVRSETLHLAGEVGRPARRYSCATETLGLEDLTHREDLVVRLLQRALEVLGPSLAEKVATEVGDAYGRDLARQMGKENGQRSIRATMESVASAMTSHGFAAHTEGEGSTVTLVSDQCPFGEAALHQPVLCAVDRGMVAGLLDELSGGTMASPVQFTSKARGDDACRTAV